MTPHKNGILQKQYLAKMAPHNIGRLSKKGSEYIKLFLKSYLKNKCSTI